MNRLFRSMRTACVAILFTVLMGCDNGDPTAATAAHEPADELRPHRSQTAVAGDQAPIAAISVNPPSVIEPAPIKPLRPAPTASANFESTNANGRTLARLHADLQRLSRENLVLQEKLGTSREIEIELEERRRAMADAERRRISTRARLDELENKLVTIEHERFERLQEAALECETRIEIGNRELEDARRMLADANARIESLAVHIVSLDDEKTGLQRAADERRAELELALAALHADNELLRTSAEERDTARTRLADAQDEIAELRGRLELADPKTADNR